VTAHTVDEALARFDLVGGSGDRERTACVMTAISWIAGEAWSVRPVESIDRRRPGREPWTVLGSRGRQVTVWKVAR